MNFIEDRTSGEEGFFWLKKILDIDTKTVVILITAFGDVELAVKAVNAALQRDTASGEGIDVVTITKDGVKTVIEKELKTTL